MSKVFIKGLTIGFFSLSGGAGNTWQRSYKFYNKKTSLISGRSTDRATAQKTGWQGFYG